MAGDFDENDLVDLNSDVEQPSEIPAENAAEIDSALDRFYGKASNADLDEAGISEEERESIQRNASKRKNRDKEQRQELREEGLESEDELDEDAVAKGEEEVPAIKEDEEVDADEQPTDEVVTPTIDPNLRYFAATTLGWSDAKLDKLIKADPELATETLTGLAETYSNLSRQMLTPGAAQPQAVTQPVVQTPAQPASPTSQLDQIYANINEFAEANGEELAGFIKALKSELIDPWRAEQAKIEVQKEELRKTEARTTFGTLSTKFTELYGEQGKARSPEQQKAVSDLAEVADQLRAGAKARGQELSISDAINRAHLLVSHTHREQVVRKQIKEQVQTRAKGISAKPTFRRNPVTSSGKSREAAAEALTRKAADLGIAGFDEN